MMFVDILRFTGYPVAKTTFFERKMRLTYPRERFICTQLELSSPYRRMKSRLDANVISLGIPEPEMDSVYCTK